MAEDIAVLKTQMNEVQEDIKSIKADIRAIRDCFNQIPDHEKRITTLEKARNALSQWGPVILSNLLTATFVFLILEYLKSR